MMYKLILLLSILFFGFILWILNVANHGESSIFFDFIKTLPYGDKLGHAFIFGFLTLAANMSLKLLHFKISGIKVYWGTMAVTVFVLVEELSQYFIPARTLDIFDLVADFLGIIVFTALSYFIGRRLFQKVLLEL